MEGINKKTSAVETSTHSDSPNERHYSAEQVNRWKQGADKYRSFEKDLGGAVNRLNKSVLDTMKAIFLGEKPAVIGVFQPYHMILDEFKRYGRRLEINPAIISELIDPVKQIIDIILHGRLAEATTIEAIGPLAEKHGLVATSKFIYDPESVRRTMESHQSTFAKYNLETPEDTMNFLENSNPPAYYEVMGLVLGYPDSAVTFFCERHALDANEIKDKLKKLLKNSPEDVNFLSNSFMALGQNENIDTLSAYFRDKLFQFQNYLGLDDAGVLKALHWIEMELSAHPYEASGFIWADRKDSQESHDKQKRLNNALRITSLIN